VRLLFDEQLSEELVTALRDLYPDSLHVRLLGKGGAADPIIWQLARSHGCVLVTKDEDFHRMSVLLGAPPKVVWLRIGNCTTADIARLLTDRVDELRRFEAEAEVTFLELG
jgi:predicted nuclease of predicted toxin-antitoxin system